MQQQVLADARYCLPLPAGPPAASLAPLLCAGLIGYRAYRKAGEARPISACTVLAPPRTCWRRSRATTAAACSPSPARRSRRPGIRARARRRWAGGSDEPPPQTLDAAIIFAPVGALIPAALAAVRPGGRVVCAGIHMSDVPAFPYRLLWGERSVASVANLTRADGEEFLALAARIGLAAKVERFALADANLALGRLRAGELTGAAVLDMAQPGGTVAGPGRLRNIARLMRSHYCGQVDEGLLGREITRRRLGAPAARPRRRHLRRPA